MPGFNALRELVVQTLLVLSASVTAAAVAAILTFLVYFSLPLFQGEGLTALLSWSWRPFQGEFGILPMLLGSLCLSATALALAFPLGVGICCFAHGVGPKGPARVVLALIHFMTSVPTVIYGFVAVFLLIPLIRDAFVQGTGFSWLAASLVLSLLILPTVVLMLHSQFILIEPRVRVTAAALGMSPIQILLHLVLPLSRRGLWAALALGFARAAGDTLIPLMLAGNAPQVPGSPLDAIRTMTAHIALVVATDSQSMAYQSLFACGMILFLTTLLVNLGLRWINAGRLDVGMGR